MTLSADIFSNSERILKHLSNCKFVFSDGHLLRQSLGIGCVSLLQKASPIRLSSTAVSTQGNRVVFIQVFLFQMFFINNLLKSAVFVKPIQQLVTLIFC